MPQICGNLVVQHVGEMTKSAGYLKLVGFYQATIGVTQLENIDAGGKIIAELHYLAASAHRHTIQLSAQKGEKLKAAALGHGRFEFEIECSYSRVGKKLNHFISSRHLTGRPGLLGGGSQGEPR